MMDEIDEIIDEAIENYEKADAKDKRYWAGFVDGLRYWKNKKIKE